MCPPDGRRDLEQACTAAVKMNAFYRSLFDGDLHADYPPEI